MIQNPDRAVGDVLSRVDADAESAIQSYNDRV
jgi:hypothetical protein